MGRANNASSAEVNPAGQSQEAAIQKDSSQEMTRQRRSEDTTVKRSWMVLFKITYFDEVGWRDDDESGWKICPKLEDAKSFVAEMERKHCDGHKTRGSSVECTILRVVECE